MPTNERLWKSGDVFDYAPEFAEKKGLQGMLTGGLSASGTVDDYPLGVDSTIGIPTGVSAADKASTSGTVTVTVTGGVPSGASRLEVIVRETATDKLVKKVDGTASPIDVDGLTDGTSYDFYVRGVANDGRVGPVAAKVSATPTSS